jgi:hypothetical protein
MGMRDVGGYIVAGVLGAAAIGGTVWNASHSSYFAEQADDRSTASAQSPPAAIGGTSAASAGVGIGAPDLAPSVPVRSAPPRTSGISGAQSGTAPPAYVEPPLGATPTKSYEFRQPGLLHMPTPGNEVKSIAIPVPTNTDYGQLIVEMDVYVDEWSAEGSDLIQNLFTVFRGTLNKYRWATHTFGYANLRGPRRNLVKFGYTADLARKYLISYADKAPLRTHTTYHCYMLFDAIGGTTLFGLSANGVKVAEIRGVASTRVIHTGPGLVVRMGHLTGTSEPVGATYGWRYSNLRVVLSGTSNRPYPNLAAAGRHLVYRGAGAANINTGGASAAASRMGQGLQGPASAIGGGPRHAGVGAKGSSGEVAGGLRGTEPAAPSQRTSRRKSRKTAGAHASESDGSGAITDKETVPASARRSRPPTKPKVKAKDKKTGNRCTKKALKLHEEGSGTAPPRKLIKLLDCASQKEFVRSWNEKPEIVRQQAIKHMNLDK